MKYYKLMNVLVKPTKANIFIPIMNIILTNKSYSSYMYLFNNLKLILYLYNIKVIWKILLSISLPLYKYIVWYYHYFKTLWVYAINHMCYNKKTKKQNNIYIKLYKIFPFIHISKKNDFLEHLKIKINKYENKKVI